LHQREQRVAIPTTSDTSYRTQDIEKDEVEGLCAISNGDCVPIEAVRSDEAVFEFLVNEGCDEVLGVFSAN